MAGVQPFFVQAGQLCLKLSPRLPGWLFTEEGQVAFEFLGNCTVTYHNPQMGDTFAAGVQPHRITLRTRDDGLVELEGDVIGAPYAAMVRDGEIESVDVIF